MTQTTEGTGPGSVAEIRPRIKNNLVREENILPELLIPVGSVLSYISSDAPDGWLVCDGQAVSRIHYSDLFAIIGTNYGVGDEETTFNLPNLSGRVIIGRGNGSGLSSRSIGDIGGSETHTLDIDEIPSHSHNVSNTVQITGSNTPDGLDDTSDEIDNKNITSTTSSTVGGGQSHNNMQPFVVLNYIIKY
jgi:microcystin-dependent protein